MKVFLLVTCFVLLLIIDISDSRRSLKRFSKSKCSRRVVYATCKMRNRTDDGDDEIRGTVYFYQKVNKYCKPTSELKVQVRLMGLNGDDNEHYRYNTRRGRLHGIHIHQFGKLGNQCLDAGPHYNPLQNDHGDRRGSPRHLGDMGNVPSDRKGRIEANFRVADTSLVKIIGRAVVLHAGRDDLGRGGNEESRRTGNSGARLACCVINRSPKKNYG